MRYDLRFRGRTADGRECRAEVSVYARSLKDLQREADLAARSADDGHRRQADRRHRRADPGR